MKLIFIGLIFVLLELNIGINVLPDFVGYLLIWKGCGDMAAESKKLASIRPVSLILAGLTGVVFVMTLLKMTDGLGIIGTIIELSMVLGSLLVIYMIGQGVRDIEGQNDVELNGVAILNSWKLLTVAEVLAYALILIGDAESILGLVASVLLLATFLFKVVLLVSAYFSQKMYKEWKHPEQE